MHSRLCKRHFTGNGYGFDGVWRHDSQRINAAKEAMFISYEWLEGRERVKEFQDAIYAFIDLFGDDVKPACRKLWTASLEKIYEDEDKKLAYFDAGMDELTKYFRRHEGLLKITTGWEHHNEQNSTL